MAIDFTRARLGNLYEEAFFSPASHYWNTERSGWHWIDSEHWRDYLAGPISQITNTGGCAYVYPREDEYFQGIKKPSALRSRLIEWHGAMVESIESYVPVSTEESEDLEAMRVFANRFPEVIDLAMDIEARRFEAQSNGA